MVRAIIAAAVSACLLGPELRAQAPSNSPATVPAGLETVRAKVASVVGNVAIRDNENAPWRPAEVGMDVSVGAEVRTGPRSSIVFQLPHQTLLLDRLGSIKLLDAVVGDDRLKTDVGMQYGRVRYSVEASGKEHESVIRSPSNALAIRGTDVEVTDDGLGSSVVLYKGQSQLVTAGGPVTLGTGAEDEYAKLPYFVRSGQYDPVQNWFNLTTPPYATGSALTQGEQEIIGLNTSVGGMDTGVGTWSWGRGWRSGGTVPTDIATPGPRPGTGDLRFTLTWSGHNLPGTPLPDLDLFVRTPGGALLTPKGQTQAGTGQISGDAGGGDATQGREFALFSGSFPIGNYNYGVQYASGEDPATFVIDIRLNGQRINPDYQDTLTPQDRRVVLTINVPQAPATTGRSQAAPARQLAATPQPKPQAQAKPVVRPTVERKPTARPQNVVPEASATQHPRASRR